MFRTVPLSIIRSVSLFTQQDQDGNSQSCLQAVSKPVWHIPLLCVQWKTPDDGQRNCLKHVEFYSKNKCGKLVHLVGFIIRIYSDVLSPKCQICFNIIHSVHCAYCQRQQHIHTIEFYVIHKLQPSHMLQRSIAILKDMSVQRDI